MKFDGIEGKRVLVTGSSRGIGAETAVAFAEAGAVVGLHCRNRKNGAETVLKRIRSTGATADLFQGDLLDVENASQLIEAFVERFGGIDVLVNNAGSPIHTRHALDVDVGTFEDTLRLNTLSPFFVAQKAISQMKLQGNAGRIINVSSIGVKYAGSDTTLHYTAAKAALETITRSLAKIVAPCNILVNAVRPGVTDTDAVEHYVSDKHERVSQIPLKRMAHPSEISNMILFLASSAGDFITGQIIAVSGGD